MPSRLDPNNLNYVLLDLVRLFRHEFERRVTEAGIGVTPAEARVLAMLFRHGPLRQHILAERLSVAQMSVCSLLDRLEGADLVERRSDPQDRRAKQAHLTDAAVPLLSRIADIGVAMREVARGDMTDAEWQAFIDGARKARENMLLARGREDRAAETDVRVTA